MTRADVLIAGAGPTGLVLALWLVKQDVRVRIIDKAAEPGTTSRAMAVQARTLELYRQLDLADAVAAAGNPNSSVSLWFKGQRREKLVFAQAAPDLTAYPYVLVYPQDQHERLLIARLQALGVTVERSTELEDFEDAGGRISARLRTPAGEEQCEAAFLAGCDGARSIVREKLGTGFPGGTYARIFYVADVEISGPQADGGVHAAFDTADFLLLLAYGHANRARLIGAVRDEAANTGRQLTFEDVGHHAIDGLGLSVDRVNWFSTYHVHHRVTDRYRVGRAFLVGDAAHLHSPAGGQGMNTGIGDAINLAWKLAAVLHGRAPEGLLDSYGLERRAFAERLVRTTDRLFTFATAEGGFADFVRTQAAPLFLPMAYSLESVRAFLFRVVSQTQISYPDSPLSEGQAGGVRGGDRLPWVRQGQGDNHAPLSQPAWQVHVYGASSAKLSAWCASRGIPLHEFAWTGAHDHAGLVRDAVYLMRPDTYVALVDATADPAVLDRYFRQRGLAMMGDSA